MDLKKLTLITITHCVHHKTLTKMFDNPLKYLKTPHNCDTRNRFNQKFFKSSVNTNIGRSQFS